MECWKCGANYELAFGEKLSFRAECESCGSWLHACCNCQYYKLGAAHDCLLPGVEPVLDKEKMNLCEEFKLLGKGPDTQGPSAKDIAQKLFGEQEEEEEDDSDPFSRLFKD